MDYSAESDFTASTLKLYYPDYKNLLPMAFPFLRIADLWVHHA